MPLNDTEFLHYQKRLPAKKHIGLIVADGVILHDLGAVADAFEAADRLLESELCGVTGYKVSLLSVTGNIVRSSTSIEIMTSPLPDDAVHFDSILIISGKGNLDIYLDPHLIAWLKMMRPTVRRIGAMCCGVLVIGSAGFLDNRHVTAPRFLEEKLMREFPATLIGNEAILEDGNIYTTRDYGMGATLAQRLLQTDLGAQFASRITANMIRQSHSLASPIFTHATNHVDNGASRNSMTVAIEFMQNNLASSNLLSLAAEFVCMSERNFQRKFKLWTGKSPHQFITHLRLENAQTALRETGRSLSEVAKKVGLSSQRLEILLKKDTAPALPAYPRVAATSRRDLRRDFPVPVAGAQMAAGIQRNTVPGNL